MSRHDSIFGPVLDALTRAMRIPHTMDSSPTQAVRVEWAESGAPKAEPPRYQRPGEQTLGRLSWPHTATIYAPSKTQAQQLLGQLWAHLSHVVGPQGGDYAYGEPGASDYVAEAPGFEFSPGAIRGVVGGDGKAAGYACDVTVTLRQTVPSMIFPLAQPVGTVEVGVNATSADGTTSETAASIAVA